MVDTTQQGRQASIGQQVRKAIYLMLPSGNATCICVAQGLRAQRTGPCSARLDGEGLGLYRPAAGRFARILPSAVVRNPDYPVGQIASMLGCNSRSAFTRWFSALFGCPPEVWREEIFHPARSGGPNLQPRVELVQPALGQHDQKVAPSHGISASLKS